MKDPVLIKSNRYGMTLRFDPELPFDLLRERVHEKLHAFTHFFNHACMVVTFEGRTFTKEEEQAMAETIEESAGIQILCLTDTEDNTQETHTITDTPVSGSICAVRQETILLMIQQVKLMTPQRQYTQSMDCSTEAIREDVPSLKRIKAL